MNVTQRTEVTVTVPRHEADQLAMSLAEVLLAMGGCCRCTGPDAFPDGGHNWRTDSRLLRELYNQLRPVGWEELLCTTRRTTTSRTW